MKLKPEIELWYSDIFNTIRIVYKHSNELQRILFLHENGATVYPSSHSSRTSPRNLKLSLNDYVKIGEL